MHPLLDWLQNGFANDSPVKYIGSKISTDKIVEVELRKFSAALDSGAPAPTTLAELREFGRDAVMSHD